MRMSAGWEAIEAVVSREQLAAALVLASQNVPPAGAGDGDDWRSELVGRYATVSGFAKLPPAAGQPPRLSTFTTAADD